LVIQHEDGEKDRAKPQRCLVPFDEYMQKLATMFVGMDPRYKG